MDYTAFKREFGIRLNPQQEAAVQQTEGAVLLLAVPGSGKTTVLITHLAFLLYCQNVPPERILTVTYTVAAARDMAARYRSAFGGEFADRLDFRTINSLCAAVVRRYARARGTRAFELETGEGQLQGLVRELLARDRPDGSRPPEQQARDVRARIAYCKNMLLAREEIQRQTIEGCDFPAIYDGYQRRLHGERRMDFDDQMVFTLRIFQKYPEILAHFQRRWPYLCVDEAQDTSRIQHIILQRLAAKSGNLFMVGDEDQSIYGFRAAWPEALLRFHQDHPGAKVLKMETNYRSTPEIVAPADAFIQRNRKRHPKHMGAVNPAGPAPRVVELRDYERQAGWLLEKIARNPGPSTAILYRNNDSALPLVDALDRAGIPFAMRQREGVFFTSPLARDLGDLLAFALDAGNGGLFLRSCYKLGLKIKKALLLPALARRREGQTVWEALLEHGALAPWQRERVLELWKGFRRIPGMDSFSAVRQILELGYRARLEELPAEFGRLDVLLALARQNRDPAALLARLGELQDILAAERAERACLTLSTIHGSKGLEYDRVILIDAVDGLLPGVPDEGSPSFSEKFRDELEEERRLFYVAVTRARRELLFLRYSRKFGEPLARGFSFVEQFMKGQGGSFLK